MRTSLTIPASTDRVWAELSDIEGSAGWMDEAISIKVTSPQHRGVGTTFVCRVRIGPLRVRDKLRVTEWVEGKRIRVVREGRVRGWDQFELKRKGRHESKV